MRAPAHGRRPILSIVLAGGEGKRLMPLTLDRAKPAVPFGGKYRLIDFAISNLVNGGFRHIVVLTQYKSHSLDVHISMTWQLSSILGNYVTTVPAQMRRGPRWYLGSADALVQNMNLVDSERPEHVIVFGADHIYRFDPRQMLEAHIEGGAGVTVAALRAPAADAAQFGTIERAADSNRILGFHEKDPNAPTLPDDPTQILASMGNYIFEAGVFREIMEADSLDETSKHDLGADIIPKLVASGDAQVYDYDDNVIPGATGSDNHYWRDVGTLDSYYDAHMDLVAPIPAFTLYNDQWPIFSRGNDEPPTRITNGPGGPSDIQNCILSNGVSVAGGRCRESVLAPNVVVDDGAEVSESVLLRNVTVGKGARLHRCIIDKNVHIPAGFAIGDDPTSDAESFHVSANGIIAVAKNTALP
ncbi:MAG: glucose-1-phosphate adenylyltransferase [Actinomycetota bacterium]